MSEVAYHISNKFYTNIYICSAVVNEIDRSSSIQVTYHWQEMESVTFDPNQSFVNHFNVPGCNILSRFYVNSRLFSGA